jgi:DNA-binding response OmpR family regulator
MTNHTCSLCGSTLSDERYGAELFALTLTKKEQVIVRTLARAKGHFVEHERFRALLWAGESRLSDEAIRNRLAGLIHLLRHKIMQTNYVINSESGRGYCLLRVKGHAAASDGIASKYRVIEIR